MKDIVCPHCKKTLLLSAGGFPHDADLNFLCPGCSSIVFGVTEAAEIAVKKVLPTVQYAGNVMGFNGSSRREALPIKINDTIVNISSCGEDSEEYELFC